MKLIKGILNLIMAGFMFVCILLSVPKLWGYQIYAVTSGSMEPELHTGDVVYVKGISFKELKEGDVITFSLNEGRTIVTHRVIVVDRENGLLRTKGDANQEEDQNWITGDALIGKVEYTVRGLGYVALMAATSGGKMFLLAVFLWILAAQMAISGIHMIYHGKGMHCYQKKEG